MDTRVQRWCAWAGLLFGLSLLASLWTAGFLPPVAPNQSAEALKRIFVEHGLRIRVGMLVGLLGIAFAGPFVAIITVQLKRVEGLFAPLAYAQLLLGAMLPIALVFAMSWLMCAVQSGVRGSARRAAAVAGRATVGEPAESSIFVNAIRSRR